ncbi:SigB/SigF/SigG family RNA polymerase sigma factor [Streptomyces sirii]|uniref:SigB/SigF/SigG family RNA polymerase sigma factor n=1 Tax=Streptomyces sirii TaxID=3127701 RepID=UPI003D3668A4
MTSNGTTTTATARTSAKSTSTGGVDTTPAEPLPLIEEPQCVDPADARNLSRLFLERLAITEAGAAEYRYARNTLIEMNLSLVRYVARRFKNRGVSVEDVLQVGAVGLIKAIDRYDVYRHVEFTTLAVPYIQGEIKRHFRDQTWAVHVPRRLQELRTDLARTRERLAVEGNHEPSTTELATRLGLAEEEVLEGLVACNCYDADSIDRPLQAGESKQVGLVADLVGEDDPALGLVEHVQALKPHLAQLDARERELLRLRFGADMTQAEIGEEFGVSQMQISRLLNRTCNKLREGLLVEE